MLKNRKILVLALSVLFAAVANFALAASPSVFVSPANLEKEKGQSFDLSVVVDGAGQKVCVVEGKINFSNLFCQSISVSDGLSIQTSPTCANPAFLLGIQGCNSAVKNLFTVNVKAINSGNAGIAFSNIDIVGEGVSISNISVGGNYTIIAPVIPAPITPPQTQSPVVESQPETTQETPGEQAIPPSEEEPAPNLITPVVSELGAESAGLLASVKNILSFGTGNVWVSVISVVIIFIILGFATLYLLKEIRKKQI